jgi:hypothetical protein
MLRLEDIDLGTPRPLLLDGPGWSSPGHVHALLGMKKAWGYQLGGSARR